MAAVTTSYQQPVQAAPAKKQRVLRQALTGGAVFDAAMGVSCLAAASTIGDWLSVSTAVVRVTGAVFLLASVAGVETLLRPSIGTRWIVGANAAFAAWCLVAIGLEAPGVVGGSILAAATAASAGTAVTEHWLGSSG
jgi:hypothetical protein